MRDFHDQFTDALGEGYDSFEAGLRANGLRRRWVREDDETDTEEPETESEE